MNRTTTLTALVAAAAVPAVGTGIAFAHAEVKTQYPTRGAAVTAVKTVSITFDEAFITGKVVSVTGPGKLTVTSSLNAKKTKLTGKLQGAAKTGTYKVRWRIKADDGDTQTGSWTFRVR